MSPSTPESPARTRFCPGPATAPLVAVELEDDVEEAEVAVPVADEEPVSEAPDAAEPLGSAAVLEVAEEPVGVALATAWIFSRPAVIVTCCRLIERSLAGSSPVVVMGSLASGPATV